LKHESHSILLRGGIAFDRRPTSFVRETIPSLRKWFDGQLVVSTWKGHEHHLEGLEKEIDVLVVSEDPGPGFIQSYNRQLISYDVGLKACVGELVFACRADFDIRTDPFGCWQQLPKKNNGFMQVFQERVIAGNMMSLPPQDNRAAETYFRISDWFQLGTRADLEKWCSVLDTSKMLYQQFLGSPDISTKEYRSEVFGTEQVWFISLLNKYVDAGLNLINYHQYDSRIAWCALMNNFYILNSRSTLNAHNLNWNFQPEFHPEYLTEDGYRTILEQMYAH
jgi:hypothetical protein